MRFIRRRANDDWRMTPPRTPMSMSSVGTSPIATAATTTAATTAATTAYPSRESSFDNPFDSTNNSILGEEQDCQRTQQQTYTRTAQQTRQQTNQPTYQTTTEEQPQSRFSDISAANSRPASPSPPSRPGTPAGFFEYGWPIQPAPVDPSRKLTPQLMKVQRSVFIAIVVAINVGLAMGALYSNVGHMTLGFVAFFKAKDVTCVLVSAVGLAWLFGKRMVAKIRHKEDVVPRRWILSLIPTYNESEEQILKCIASLRDNGLGPHRQVMVVIMDGKPKELRSSMTSVVLEYERPYDTLKYTQGSLRIAAGWIRGAPVILIEKAKNCGKKDSLIICHDLFNAPRDNMPEYTKLLRKDIWEQVLPALTGSDSDTDGSGSESSFDGFHGIFCTDADSKLHEGALRYLIEALHRDPKAIAACGSVYVELEPGYAWSFWNLYQQFQYTFGQFVRRRAEGIVGRVTCLPGCVTMIAVRDEMAGAITKYAAPVTTPFILRHQVQNLGTDRRLTYSMLSQSTGLHTLFVPEAGSETVAPQSLKHYLSQRRRWGSNAHFNSYMYMAGENMHPLIRVWAAVDVARQLFVYYRILNTVFFIKALVTSFIFMDILPLLVVGQLPLLWYFVCMVMEPGLRKRAHKLILGFIINKLISPFMSIMVFTEVAFHLGSNVWGLSGITASSAPAANNNEKAADPQRLAEEGFSEKVVTDVQQPSAVFRPSSRQASIL